MAGWRPAFTATASFRPSCCRLEYANGVLSYLPTADEYPYGGYECNYAHHSYGLAEQGLKQETPRAAAGGFLACWVA